MLQLIAYSTADISGPGRVNVYEGKSQPVWRVTQHGYRHPHALMHVSFGFPYAAMLLLRQVPRDRGAASILCGSNSTSNGAE